MIWPFKKRTHEPAETPVAHEHESVKSIAAPKNVAASLDRLDADSFCFAVMSAMILST